MDRLAERVIIVNGGATELGRSVSLRCADQGAHVVIADADATEGLELQAKIEGGAGQAAFLSVDFGDEDSIQTMIGDAVMTFGSVDGIVNCSLGSGHGDALSTTVDEWRDELGRRLRGTWLTCKYALPFLSKSEHAAIVNVGEADAGSAAPRRLLAATVQGGLMAMTKSLAVDYSPHGIRVNSICCGFIELEATRLGLQDTDDPAAELERILALHPLGRLGQPRDVARAALFLLSDDASFITGTSLTVDGGRSIAHQGLDH